MLQQRITRAGSVSWHRRRSTPRARRRRRRTCRCLAGGEQRRARRCRGRVILGGSQGGDECVAPAARGIVAGGDTLPALSRRRRQAHRHAAALPHRGGRRPDVCARSRGAQDGHGRADSRRPIRLDGLRRAAEGSREPRRPIEVARASCYATALALAQVPGVIVAAAAFPGNGKDEVIMMARFEERIDRQAARFASLEAGGGTPMAEAMLWGAAQLLEQRKPRRILLVTTDGAYDAGAWPSDGQQAQGRRDRGPGHRHPLRCLAPFRAIATDRARSGTCRRRCSSCCLMQSNVRSFTSEDDDARLFIRSPRLAGQAGSATLQHGHHQTAYRLRRVRQSANCPKKGNNKPFSACPLARRS